jgi:N-methylhydantoinase A
MAAATRAHATDRGVDHRGLALLAFGGAGPVHACAVGELLASSAVIFPPQASVLSAVGTLVTPVRLDLVRSALARLDSLDWDAVAALLDDMEREGFAALAEAGCERASVRISHGADLRYHGQQNEVGVTFDHDPRARRDPEAIRQTFEAAYRTLYGVTPSHVPVEVVSWRMTVQGPEAAFAPTAAGAKTPGAPKTERPVGLWPGVTSAKVYDRAALAVGQQVAGPAIIEERETTLVIPPGWTGAVDALGCVVARQEA